MVRSENFYVSMLKKLRNFERKKYEIAGFWWDTLDIRFIKCELTLGNFDYISSDLN